MKSWNSPLFLRSLVFFLLSVIQVSNSSRPNPFEHQKLRRRVLLSFKDTPKGSNITFECSPSGPCVPCLYSEKNTEKYRCSETGYRIPLKCVAAGDDTTGKENKESHKNRLVLEESGPLNGRTLLDGSSAAGSKRQSYTTYRSCIPPAGEEKLSVVGFEGIALFLLLASGTFMYYRKKHSVTTMPGVGATRIPTNPRF